MPALRAAFAPVDALTQKWLRGREQNGQGLAARLLALRLRTLAFETAEIEQLLAEEPVA
ncbi:hypothetical protein [Hymenobacter sp. UYP22]|uniref:hypothetical protein n=1 Tax=Hymenobacter sp. UYP22 TaxID=3156348 RepID=UPI003390AACD